MNLIGFQPYGTPNNASTSAKGARTAGCGSCRDTRMVGAHTGATSWASLSASVKKTLTPQFKLWPAVHVGADTTLSPIATATTTIADVVAIAVGGAVTGAAGYFIGGATKSNWVPVVSGALVGSFTRVGLLLGGVIAYAGAYYARK